MIFDEQTLNKLNQLTLTASKIRAGIIKGERRSTKRGTSIEFADYRNYTAGDDLRRLDWNIFARLDRPFIKLLEEEEDLMVHILLDISKSMDWGEGETNKEVFSLRIGAALGVIALSSGDRLAVNLINDGTISRRFGPVRSPQQIVRLLEFLQNQSKEFGGEQSGTTDLNASLRRYAMETHRVGLAFLISDLLSPGGHLDGLNRLLSQGYEITFLHILNPDEIDPPLAGDLRLMDIETGQYQEVSLDSGLREVYRSTFNAWQKNIQFECIRRGVHYMPLSTATPWDKVILHEMRKASIVK